MAYVEFDEYDEYDGISRPRCHHYDTDDFDDDADDDDFTDDADVSRPLPSDAIYDGDDDFEVDDYDADLLRPRCFNRCTHCVLNRLVPTAEQRSKRRVHLLWLIVRYFPNICADVVRAIVVEWVGTEQLSPAFTTFTLRCAVNAYLFAPQHKTVRSWGPIRYWDTRAVTHFDSLFQNAVTFNERLSWDTRNAESMARMFDSARAFNQPVDFRFDKVRTTEAMFAGATSFNQPFVITNAPHWFTARRMFHEALAMNADVYCNAPNLKDVFQMFRGVRAFRARVTMTRKLPISVESMALPAGTRICIAGIWDWTVRTTYDYY